MYYIYNIAHYLFIPWWRHQMETFSALLPICAGNSPVIGEYPAQRTVTRSFAVFFDLRLNKRLSKQWWGWWFETPSRPLWRHCNAFFIYVFNLISVCTCRLQLLAAVDKECFVINPKVLKQAHVWCIYQIANRVWGSFHSHIFRTNIFKDVKNLAHLTVDKR